MRLARRMQLKKQAMKTDSEVIYKEEPQKKGLSDWKITPILNDDKHMALQFEDLNGVNNVITTNKHFQHRNLNLKVTTLKLLYGG